MKEEFNELIKSKDLENITSDLIEAAIDNSLDDDILKEIPVLKTLVGVKNIYNTISDKIFIKKAMHVLLEIGEVNWKQRIELTQKLDDNNSSGIEKLLMHIDKLESIEKCKVFGRLCKLKALGRVDRYDFLRLTKLIQDAYLEDLSLIRHFERNDIKEINTIDYYHVISLGLLVQVHIQKHKGALPLSSAYGSYYSLSNLGQSLINIYDDLLF